MGADTHKRTNKNILQKEYESFLGFFHFFIKENF
jgi:hypothetical protein